MNPLDDELPEGGDLPNPLRDPIGTARRRWRPMLVVLGLSTLLTVVVSLLVEPLYYAEATVVVARQKVSERIVAPTMQEDALTRIEALAVEVLSRTNLARLVNEFGLYPERRNRETMAEIVDRVRSHVTIGAVETVGHTTGELTARAYLVGFEAATPEAAAGVANALASLLVDTSLEERYRRHQLTTDFLRRELDQAERALREQNRAVSDFKQANRGLLPSDLQANLTRLDLLQNQRQSLALQIAEGGTHLATLAAQGNTPDARLALLRDELVRLRASHTSSHPDVIEIEQQIADLEAARAGTGPPDRASPRNLVHAAEQTQLVLRQQLAATEAELAQLDARIGRMPAVQEGLASLEEKALILRESYLEFLRKVQDSQLDENLLKAQQGERVSLLNTAEPPSHPARSRWQYLAIGLVASLGLALLAGLALEFLDPVVVAPDQLTRLVGQPVLGWVARIH